MKPRQPADLHQKPSLVVKRSLVVAGRYTSICLEEAFWNALNEIAALKDVRVQDLVSVIDQERHNSNLSSAIRLFILAYYRS